jgi:pyruvate/2-oxoglutarate dehydrogenase complex dihydrolipoamide dehydrogenase (E3) component
MKENCDVIVLGMGTCGEDAALRLGAAGLDVVGIEARLIGGECPFWACLPTKSMVRSASLVKEARRANGLVGKVTVEPDWSVIASRLRAEVTGGWDDAAGVARFEAKGYGFPTFHGAVGEALGAYGRGIVRVLDPPTPPMFDDPLDSWRRHDEAVTG